MGNAIIAAARRLAEAGAPVLHDISTGGLAVALAEICLASDVGAEVAYDDWRALFSEDPHRLVAIAPDSVEVEAIASSEGVPARCVGAIRGSTLAFGRAKLDLVELRQVFDSNFR